MLKLFAALFLFFLLPISVHAKEKLMILTEENPPLSYAENGKITGFVTDVVNQLLKTTENEHAVIEIYPWARAYKMAKNKANILLYTTARTQKREAQFKWVGPVAKRTMWIWKLKKRKDIRIHNLDDVKNYSFSIVPNSAGANYLLDHGFTKKQLNYMPHDTQTMKTFLLERNEFVLKTKLSMSFSLRMLGKSMDIVEPVFQLQSEGDYYLAFSLGTPDNVVVTFQNALNELKKNGSYDRIEARWMK